VIVALDLLIVLMFPALVTFVRFSPKYEVIETETVHSEWVEAANHVKGCDLQPDCNLFWTTKKRIGEFYDSGIELHPSILPSMPYHTSIIFGSNRTYF
jgi:hypothetical protein